MREIDEKVKVAVAYERIDELIDRLDEVYLNKQNYFCQESYFAIENLLQLVYPEEYDVVYARLEKLKEQNLLNSISANELANVLKFNKAEFEMLLKKSWAFLMDFYRIYCGDYNLVSKNFKKRVGLEEYSTVGLLLRTNAVLPQKKGLEGLRISASAVESFKHFINSLASQLAEKLERFDNVIIVPFLRDREITESGKIVITFNAEYREKYWLVSRKGGFIPVKSQEYDITENMLKENVVLILSPYILGYQPDSSEEKAYYETRSSELSEKHIITCSYKVMPLGKYDLIAEYNALGEVGNLKEVKQILGGSASFYKVSPAEYPPLMDAIKYLEQR